VADINAMVSGFEARMPCLEPIIESVTKFEQYLFSFALLFDELPA
jgi:hypothetical protein